MKNKTQRNPLGIKSLPSKQEALNQIRRDEFLGGLGRGKSLIEIEEEEARMEITYPECFQTKEFDMKSNICKNCEFQSRCPTPKKKLSNKSTIIGRSSK